MKTREQLRKEFEPINDEQLERLMTIQEAGARHGNKGWYPNCDYSSDADWVYGVGAAINKLDSELGIDDGCFEVYLQAHQEALGAEQN